jgi:soluble lytic murein transglycosylase-like protein
MIVALIAAAAAPTARADYVVLRSGIRLHVKSYERTGDTMRLAIEGGTVEVGAADVVTIEPEDLFKALPAPSAAAGPYANLIRQAALNHGLDEALITSVIAAESNFNPHAVSRKQALGLMQLLPSTARRYSVTDIFDPAQNINAGTQYLKELLEQYHGNLALALAAYNAGPERVVQFRGVPPYPETRAYLKRVTTSMANQKKPAAGIRFAAASKPSNAPSSAITHDPATEINSPER